MQPASATTMISSCCTIASIFGRHASICRASVVVRWSSCRLPLVRHFRPPMQPRLEVLFLVWLLLRRLRITWIGILPGLSPGTCVLLSTAHARHRRVDHSNELERTSKQIFKNCLDVRLWITWIGILPGLSPGTCVLPLEDPPRWPPHVCQCAAPFEQSFMRVSSDSAFL